MRFLCLRLTLWASACVDPHGYRPSPGSVLLLHPGFLSSGLVVWGSFHPVHSPLSSFGMWSPFRVISVLCHYWSPMKVSFGGVFRLGGSLPFRSGVVVSLRPLSVCLGSMWLVPAFFPSLSLSFPVCTHLQLGRTFFLLPDWPSPYFGLLVYWFLWLLFSTRVTYLRDGVTPAGSWTDCPRS